MATVLHLPPAQDQDTPTPDYLAWVRRFAALLSGPGYRCTSSQVRELGPPMAPVADAMRRQAEDSS